MALTSLTCVRFRFAWVSTLDSPAHPCQRVLLRLCGSWTSRSTRRARSPAAHSTSRGALGVVAFNLWMSPLWRSRRRSVCDEGPVGEPAAMPANTFYSRSGQPGVPPNRSLPPATRNMSPSVTTSVEWPVSIVDGAIALSVSFIGYES